MSDEAGGIRGAEQRQLRQLILPGPRIRVVTVRGEAGIGKTTLLAGIADAAAGAGWRVLRASGSTSEARLSLAGLHQLLRPLLSAVDDLPPAQRAAFNAALGLARGRGSADLLQLYIACLALLSQQSGQAPLLLVVDDAQWIDQATLDILGFIARRLADDPIAMVFGSREAVAADLGPDSRTMHLSPLTALEANQLLDLQPLPPAGDARAAILDQAAGNPLGLVELTRAVAADATAAVGWRGRALALTDRLRQSFTASALMLSEQTHRALLLAAADDNIELNLSYLTGSLGVPADAWQPAQAAGLIAVSGGSATFSHPLIRSAIYQAASPAARSAAHRALAAALQHQPERQAWQLAAATTGPDEALAKRLESIAEEASAQSRFETATAAWQRAAELSADPQAAAQRLGMAASATGWIGQVDRAASLANRALELTTEPAARGRVRAVLGWALSLTFQHGKTVALMSDLAPELAGTEDMVWATEGLAAKAAYYSGEDALRGRVLAMLHTLNGGLPAWQAAAGSGAEVRASALWCGTALRPLTDRSAKLTAIRELTSQVSPRQYVPLAAAALLADDPRRAVMLRDHAEDTPELLGRGTALMVITWSLLETGQWDDALEYAGRARTLTAIYHEPVVHASVITAAAYIAACRGHSAAAAEDAMSVLGISGLTARSSMTARANHAMGMAALVQDRNDEAFDWLRQLAADDGRAAHNREALFALIDLAEAARRTGRRAEASRLVEGALAGTQDELSPRLLQVSALCRALLADGTAAEEHFLKALSVTEGDHVPLERARMRLSYGQWLRRERRDKDARPHLNATAHVFRLLAATPWLTAATHEQRAAGVRSGSSPADEGRFSMRATDGFCGEGYTAFRPHPAVRRPELP
ncbi:MAG TPA: AAA family ATPase [Streptosporangiaceae bacterium]|jgi:tetratricopeptide (TPR) repeat protein|nr:AAA family ATPase [Streptosporangiaceae bacterium]